MRFSGIAILMETDVARQRIAVGGTLLPPNAHVPLILKLFALEADLPDEGVLCWTGSRDNWNTIWIC